MTRTAIGFATVGDIPLARLAALAALADERGLSSLWIADEPFFRGAMPAAVACAMRTRRIRIGLGIVNPYDHPPVSMAKDFATLQELGGERCLLGIGASWRPPIEAQGIPWTKPLSAVADTVRIVRTLASGDSCTYVGEKFAVAGVQLGFEPTVKEPRILVASMFPRSLVQAGRIADGVILSILCPVEYLARARRYLAEGAAAAGRALDRFEIVQYLPLEVSIDGEDAKRSIKRLLAFFIRQSYGPDPGHWVKVAELGGFDVGEFAAIYEQLQRGEAAERAVPDSFVRRFAVAGTPAQCAETIAAYERAGMTEAVAVFAPWSDLERQIELIGEHLIPEGRAL